MYSLCILPSILQNIQLNIRFNVQVYWYIKREMVEKWNGERIRNTPNLYHNGHINITLVSINAKNGRSILYYHCVWYFQHKWCKAQVAVYPKMHASMFNECNRKLWDKLNKLIEWEDFAIKFCTHTHTHTQPIELQNWLKLICAESLWVKCHAEKKMRHANIS